MGRGRGADGRGRDGVQQSAPRQRRRGRHPGQPQGSLRPPILPTQKSKGKYKADLPTHWTNDRYERKPTSNLSPIFFSSFPTLTIPQAYQNFKAKISEFVYP